MTVRGSDWLTALLAKSLPPSSPSSVSHLIFESASEKGGKAREIPVRHDLEQILRVYIEAAQITEGPLFRTAVRRREQLTTKALSGIDICRLMKRRLRSAGLPGHFSPHSFRVATVTDLLEQNVALDDVQHLAGHADPRTTRLYDRRRRRVTRNIVERISI